MKSRLKWLLYGLYTFAAIIFFLFVLFPEKTVREHAKGLVQNLHPGLTLTIAKAVPKFPISVCLKEVSLMALGETVADVDSLVLRTSFHSIFGRDNDIFFKFKAYGGDIQGMIENNYSINEDCWRLNAIISDLRLESIPPIHKLDYQISGLLNMKVDYQREGTSNANAIMEFYNARVGLPSPFFGQTFFDFKKADATVSVRENIMEITECKIKGLQTDIILSGTVVLKQPLNISILKLNGFINPHLAFLKDLNKKTPLKIFPEKKAGKKGFSFKIKGTIDRPGFFWD
jgi:type II secretion system protein N